MEWLFNCLGVEVLVVPFSGVALLCTLMGLARSFEREGKRELKEEWHEKGHKGSVICLLSRITIVQMIFWFSLMSCN